MTEFDSPDSPGGAATEAPSCPKCQGPMWDNREGKRNPKAPDFKCKDKDCGGVIWPPRSAVSAAAPAGAPAAPRSASGSGSAADPAAVASGSPACPICGGPMWDDRSSKRNPRAPDFKCKNRPRERGGPGCEGVIWPPRDGTASPYGAPPAPRANASAGAPRSRGAAHGAPPPYDGPPPDDTPPPDDDDLIPF